ncbi:hypothetical protein SAMN04487860_11814 [Ruminococcus flavefaciens]|uniref:Uncharacterized protein n=1 Tax=Ruminococcus flavefaciens TaxID=1265 RepID=A0A1M7M3L9_RUMFL|nr:hypothetical protein SAMN04487860_11814 [Ruminococcus flavefaciens]
MIDLILILPTPWLSPPHSASCFRCPHGCTRCSLYLCRCDRATPVSASSALRLQGADWHNCAAGHGSVSSADRSYEALWGNGPTHSWDRLRAVGLINRIFDKVKGTALSVPFPFDCYVISGSRSCRTSHLLSVRCSH